MSIKLDRLSHIFTEEISNVIQKEVRDETISFVTITYTKISSDLSYAKVYFTVLDLDKKEEIEKSLNKASHFIRSKLFDRIEIRKMPEISFVYDESVEYGNNIEHIIERINKED